MIMCIFEMFGDLIYLFRVEWKNCRENSLHSSTGAKSTYNIDEEYGGSRLFKRNYTTNVRLDIEIFKKAGPRYSLKSLQNVCSIAFHTIYNA